tara:strand:+ start:157 stop:348 length:192 start_codon:yes stop_codon:yes gene_type:complete
MSRLFPMILYALGALSLIGFAAIAILAHHRGLELPLSVVVGCWGLAWVLSTAGVILDSRRGYQ